MQVIIQPSRVSGSIQASASKSSMQRACASALLLHGETIIRNPGHSNDDKAALGVISALGATIEWLNNDIIKVVSNGVRPTGDSVNCGESGLGIRMFAPLIAMSEKRITINGEGSLLKRPMDFFDEVFPQLNVNVVSNQGRLPLQVRGPLQPKNIEIDGSLSSQFLTGLLMAYAATGAEDVFITVNDLKSKPYIDLTLQVMKHFGWEVENRDYASFYFKAKPVDEHHAAIDYTVEGDWSGAAFLLVAGAIAGPITVKGLDINSTQADKKIIEALKDCACEMEINGNEITVSPSSTGLKPFYFDATNCPDLFPPLVALAAYCKGTTTIEGVGRLAHKESDRAATLQEEFGKMGVRVMVKANQMFIEGGQGVHSAHVHSHHDHRIAMACATAGLQANGDTIISGAEAVNKSYPDFYAHLESLQAKVKTKLSTSNIQ